MPKGIRINSVQPYTTISPRRALHPTSNPNGVLHGKVVRQADGCADIGFINHSSCCSDKDGGFVTDQYAISAGAAVYKSCERMACENPEASIEQNEYRLMPIIGSDGYTGGRWLPVISRIESRCVTAQEVKSANQSVVDFYRSCCVSVHRSDGLPPFTSWPQLPIARPTVPPYAYTSRDTYAYKVDCQPQSCLALPVPSQVCESGFNSPQNASQVARDYPCILPTLASAAAGASTLLGTLLPTPTASIAASAPSYVVGALGAAIGVSGAVGAIGIASYAGYKLVNYLKDHPFQSSGHSLEEAQKMIDEAIEIEMQPMGATEPRYTEVLEAEHIYETLEEAKTEHAA